MGWSVEKFPKDESEPASRGWPKVEIIPEGLSHNGI
jgi:hypothetical protein